MNYYPYHFEIPCKNGGVCKGEGFSTIEECVEECKKMCKSLDDLADDLLNSSGYAECEEYGGSTWNLELES